MNVKKRRAASDTPRTVASPRDRKNELRFLDLRGTADIVATDQKLEGEPTHVKGLRMSERQVRRGRGWGCGVLERIFSHCTDLPLPASVPLPP